MQLTIYFSRIIDKEQIIFAEKTSFDRSPDTSLVFFGITSESGDKLEKFSSDKKQTKNFVFVLSNTRATAFFDRVCFVTLVLPKSSLVLFCFYVSYNNFISKRYTVQICILFEKIFLSMITTLIMICRLEQSLFSYFHQNEILLD